MLHKPSQTMYYQFFYTILENAAKIATKNVATIKHFLMLIGDWLSELTIYFTHTLEDLLELKL
jgi:hypothetical protein